MKVFVEISRTAATASRAELSAYVHRLEDAGATGVCLSDHLFTADGSARPGGVQPDADPFTVLACVAGLSQNLELQTMVANTTWAHPGLLLRHFAQLAVLVGGERVTAGLGAGWNAPELNALGMRLAPHQDRVERLEETLAIARQLFDTGVANLDGRFVTAHHLPLSPRPGTSPRLLVGGGSDQVAELAGRYADVVDLQGHPRYATRTGKHNQHRADAQRRALTSVDDLVEQMKLARSAAEAAGRSPNVVRASVQIVRVVYASGSKREDAERDLRARWPELSTRPIAENPFVLIGEPALMADVLNERADRLGLDRISLCQGGDIKGALADAERFCREVLPRLTDM